MCRLYFRRRRNNFRGASTGWNKTTERCRIYSTRPVCPPPCVRCVVRETDDLSRIFSKRAVDAQPFCQIGDSTESIENRIYSAETGGVPTSRFRSRKDLGCWYPLYRRYRSLDSDRSLARIRMRIASDSDSDRLISNARAALFIPKNLRVRWYQPRERRAGGLRDSRSGGEYTHGTARMPSERIGAPRLLRYARRCLRVTERAELVY